MTSCAAGLRSSQRTNAEARRALYRDHGTVSNIEIARVMAGWEGDDSLSPKYAYFLRMPDGKIVRTEGLAWFDYPPLQTINRLGFSSNRIDASLIYDEVVERISRRYCLARVAKPPFTGEEVKCAVSEEARGLIDYMPGAFSVEAARARVCQVLGHDTPASCNALRGSGYFCAERPPLPRAYWIMRSPSASEWASTSCQARKPRAALNQPLEYDERTYIVSSDTGAVTLLNKATVRCPKNVCQTMTQD